MTLYPPRPIDNHVGNQRRCRDDDDHLIEQEFEGRSWIVGDAPTIADIACFPYTALAGDGGIELTPFKAVQRWLRMVSDLPNFIPMPGIRGIK